MTRPTRNRPASLFAATAADLPLFSGTCQRAEAQQCTPREQIQQDSMFDRREYIQKPVKRTTHRFVESIPNLVIGSDEIAYRVFDNYVVFTRLMKNGLPLQCEIRKNNKSFYGEKAAWKDVICLLVDFVARLQPLAPETNTELRQSLDD